MRREELRELRDARVVGPAGAADQDRPAGAQHVAAIHCTRWLDAAKRPIAAERIGDERHLGTARRRARAHDHGQLIEDVFCIS